MQQGLVPRADLIGDAARELAGKIKQSLGTQEEATLTVRSISSLDADDVLAAQRGIENALRAHDIRLVEKPEGAAKVSVTLSENLSNYIWIAEIQSNNTEVVMATAARKAGKLATSTSMILESKAFFFELENPILDLSSLDRGLLVLDTEAISLYRRAEARWEVAQSVAIPGSPSSPRDMRGRLLVRNNSLQVYLPGRTCTGTLEPALSLECKVGTTAWPTEFGPAELESGKNFFSASGVGPFFTVAGARDRETPLWVFAELDGRAHFYTHMLAPGGAFAGWGSDITGIESACGCGRQVLASLPSDACQPDSIQAFEIVDRQAIAVSPPVELPGPVTALWREENPNAAIAVSRDLRTGRYAAFRLSISCGR